MEQRILSSQTLQRENLCLISRVGKQNNRASTWAGTRYLNYTNIHGIE